MYISLQVVLVWLEYVQLTDVACFRVGCETAIMLNCKMYEMTMAYKLYVNL
jgi:hypothetical protein